MGSNFNEPGELAAVVVRVVNDFALGGFSSRVVFNHDIFKVQTAYLTGRGMDLENLTMDTTETGVLKCTAFSLQPRTDYIPAGAGAVYIIEFYILDEAPAGNYLLELADSDYGYENHFSDTTGNQMVLPVLMDGYIEVLPPSYIDQKPMLPEEYTTITNYPNPFNCNTKLSLNIGSQGDAMIAIFDILGNQIKKINLGALSPGQYTTIWNGRNDFEKEVASGVYCYTLYMNHESIETKKMSLIR
jgi:hypothetical protein